MKGISPIIASVLLIAITMSIAVVLAAYVTSYTREATEAIPSACIGGALFVHGTPDCTGSTLTIDLEANYVTLTDFKADSRDSTGGIIDSAEPRASGSSLLAPAEIGTVTFTLPSTCAGVDQVRVTTNCFNVRTAWTSV